MSVRGRSVYEVPLDVEVAAALARLLDEALDLPAHERLPWVDSLGPDCDHLKPRLRRMLEAEARKDESNFLGSLPRIAAADGSGLGSDPSDSASADLPRHDALLRTRLRERFDLFECLGSGGFGTVFRAWDRIRGATVAAKILDRVDPAALRLFKGEFRAIAGVTHPNLIKLYDLCCVDGVWILTMEVVHGRSFREYVWPDSTPHPDARFSRSEYEQGVDRVRACLRQLDGALKALHAAGILHRDLKPSNVLIDRSDRLVVLDFGVAVHLGRGGDTGTAAMGTPAYMSPERTAAEASDWYSVGVMLFEVLTGRLPFHGDPLEVLRRKRTDDPPAPATLVPWVPPDLNDLCVGLLERDPSRRTIGVTVAPASAGPAPRPDAGIVRGPVLVGRTRELAALERAYDDACGGHACVVQLRGASGIGKTALIEAFSARRRAASPRAAVLAGRCHERESVPFKALDGVIDSLSRYLDRQDPERSDAIAPTDVLSVRRVFPTLRSLGRQVGGGAAEPADPHTLRSRAFDGLRDLLVRLSQRVPVVMTIDDVQWGDADSARALEMILRPPLQARLLVMVAYRSDLDRPRPVVECLDALARQQLSTRLVNLEGLGHTDAVELARTLAPQTVEGLSASRLDALAHESSGHPVLLQELLRDEGWQPAPADAVSPAPSLNDLIGRRFAALPGSQRRLVELLAVCAKPLAADLALKAAGIDAGDLRAVDSLVASHLIRSTVAERGVALETYHDKVRESVTSAMSAEAIRDRHGALAEALAGAQGEAAEQLVEHYALSGDARAAARAARHAANNAAQGLAFERASRLYALALQQGTWPDGVRSDLEEALARSLAHAGQARQAAEQFLVAARGADSLRALALRRDAGEQFLRAGHIEAGAAVLRSVLADVGARWPAHRWQIILGILFASGRLWWRSLRPSSRPPDGESPGLVRRVDALMAPALGLMFVDPLLSFYFMRQAALAAQDAGEPERLALTMGFGAASAMRSGDRRHRRAERDVAASISMARSIGSARALACGKSSAAVLASLRGNWRQVSEDGLEAEAILVASCTGVVGELNLARAMLLLGLSMTGQWKRLRDKLAAIVMEGEQRGDLVATSRLPLLAFSYRCRLVEDQPERALDDMERQVAQCSYVRPGSISVQNYAAHGGKVDTLLYCRRYAEAYEAVAADFRGRSTFIRTIQILRIDLYARAALALAIHGGSAHERPRLLRQVRGAIRTLEHDNHGWSNALASRLRAGLASIVGDREGAIHHLSRAEAGFARAGMEYLQACTGSVLNDLAPTRAPRAHDQAAAWFAREGVVRPDLLVAGLVPGAWDRVRP